MCRERRLFLPLLKHILYHRKSRERIRPARVESDLGHNFGGLWLGQAVVHGTVQVIRDLWDLARSNQRAHRHEAAVARCQSRPEPQVAEEQIGSVLDKTRRDLPEVVIYLGGSL